MSFIDFINSVRAAYGVTISDVINVALESGTTITPTTQDTANTITAEENNTNFKEYWGKPPEGEQFYKEDKDALIYPEDLFQAGNEAYILFYMRDSIYSNAPLMKRIALYMPPGIKVNYGTNWSEVNMFITKDQQDALRTDAEAVLNSENMSQGFEVIKQMFKRDASVQSALQTAATKAVGQMALSRTNIGQMASVITQKSVNPMTALSFKSVNLRSFAFRFELLARSVEESVAIRRIINCFKYGMHPNAVEGAPAAGLGDSTTNKLAKQVFLNYPNTFDIYLYTPSLNYMFNIQRSVLVNMNVDYCGSKVASFFKGTGAPTNIILDLQFRETELLTKDRVVKGY